MNHTGCLLPGQSTVILRQDNADIRLTEKGYAIRVWLQQKE
jgi:tRNA U34 5-carboxymethylaminomethyl modifying enzyme MnmG/GidA